MDGSWRTHNLLCSFLVLLQRSPLVKIVLFLCSPSIKMISQAHRQTRTEDPLNWPQCQFLTVLTWVVSPVSSALHLFTSLSITLIFLFQLYTSSLSPTPSLAPPPPDLQNHSASMTEVTWLRGQHRVTFASPQHFQTQWGGRTAAWLWLLTPLIGWPQQNAGETLHPTGLIPCGEENIRHVLEWFQTSSQAILANKLTLPTNELVSLCSSQRSLAY